MHNLTSPPGSLLSDNLHPWPCKITQMIFLKELEIKSEISKILTKFSPHLYISGKMVYSALSVRTVVEKEKFSFSFSQSI